jgi:hypothetical protein
MFQRGAAESLATIIVVPRQHPFNITLIDLWRLFVGSRKLYYFSDMLFARLFVPVQLAIRRHCALRGAARHQTSTQ